MSGSGTRTTPAVKRFPRAFRGESVSLEVRVRLFAVLREAAGSDEVELRLRPGATAGEALAELARMPGLGELLAKLPVRLAVNRELAEDGDQLAPDDELALIPPVSGGALLHARITDSPISPEALCALVGDPGAGAIVVFQGVPREVPMLEYEAYREMAEERMGAILATAAERHGLLGAAVEHRIGDVPLGEPAVVVAVSAPHREEAFAGAREAIDEIKAQAPIWKREVSEAR